MGSNALPSAQRPGNKGGKFFPALCNVLGTLILIFVILTGLPLALPRFLGYEAYNVVSGSMEPAIPMGSIVYVETLDPAEIQAGDVIAFWDDATVVTHRVKDNYKVSGEFITKGDANEKEDINPVPYSALIGRVKLHIPVLGQFMTLYASQIGKIYLLCFAACGVMFNVLAGRIRESSREKCRRRDAELLRHIEAAESAAVPQRQQPAGKKPKKKKVLRTVLMILFLAVFLFSGGTVAVVKHQYKVSDRLYGEAAAQFTRKADSVAPIARPQVPAEAEYVEELLPECAPIAVDFEALQEVNPDVVGWIYCPDTVINYPVLQGEDNDIYLTHSYNGIGNASGSIFVESTNRPGFADSNSIIYGHHMNDNSMFATLDRWQNQAYYEEHPVMWLLTPEQDYKILLFSGYTTASNSETYVVYDKPSTDFTNYVKIAALYSEFKADVELNPNSHYVVLSTCAYVFDNARSVLHGRLAPLSSAGGVPFAE